MDSGSNTRRKVMHTAVCGILSESGFDFAEKAAVETLTEMLQSVIVEIGQSSKNFCELSGRTEVMMADVVIALANMGLSLENIQSYAFRIHRTSFPPLQQQVQLKQQNILQAGVKQQHPPHIPNHLPPLPDPHAYIRTPTHKQPVTEYEAIREKAAVQKKDIERALTRFIAKTGETHNLFLTEDNSTFPLIACKPQPNIYIAALLPQDQIFETDPEFEVEPSPSKKRKTQKTENNDEAAPSDAEITKQSEEICSQQETIDNPYLRPGTMPKSNDSSPNHYSSLGKQDSTGMYGS